jgi:hypothetical protein
MAAHNNGFCQVISGGEEACRRACEILRCSIYSLYKYNSTNTDAKGAPPGITAWEQALQARTGSQESSRRACSSH